MKRYVQSKPYPWPYNGDLRPDNTALIVIDMQVDFCGKGGYVDQMGYDLELTRAPIPAIKKALEACRKFGFHVLHTREGHRPDLADLPPNKRWRSRQIGAGIGDPGPCGKVLIRGEPGWEIIPELAPIEGEPIIDKPGKGSFYATDLDLILRLRGIQNLVVCGITTDVCVHTTMRDANDMGYECLLLTDGTGATDAGNHNAAIKMVQMQGGVFGAVSTADQFADALEPPVARALAAQETQGADPETSPAEASSETDGPAATSKATPEAAGSGPTDSAEGDAAAADAAEQEAVKVDVVTVTAKPYDYKLPLKNTALVLIDFQRDFLEEGGFAAALGNDLSLLQECIEPAARLLAACRKAGLPIVHTLEAHHPTLCDLPLSKWQRGNPPKGFRIGDEGVGGKLLIAGEPGNGIVDELMPLEGELQLHKPGKGSFYATGFEEWLRARDITHLMIGGVTTEVCVQTTMREANDRGFECVLVTDATGSFFPQFKAATIEMVTSQGGIVGWATDTAAIEAALAATTIS